jgi:NAD(P)-dependent dehydrogenase (short-subunit alcohol dehydrogenase family)
VIQADIGFADQVKTMFASLDQAGHTLGLLVNNAGVQTFCSILELQEADWDRTIRTNLKGTFLCTQAAGRRMRTTNKRPFPMLSNYCASKGGIQTFTNVAAVELGPHGIRVNCVAPGAIEIERTKQEAPDYAGTWAPITPMRRVGTPEDVAAAVVYLASPEAEFVTGQTLYVDGGLFTQGPWPYDTHS